MLIVGVMTTSSEPQLFGLPGGYQRINGYNPGASSFVGDHPANGIYPGVAVAYNIPNRPGIVGIGLINKGLLKEVDSVQV